MIPGLGVPAFNVLKGGLGGAIGSILGKAPPDRNQSLKIRDLRKRGLAGDQSAINELKRMAYTQGSKFPNINRKAVQYYAEITGEVVPWRGQASSPSTAWEAVGQAFGLPSTLPGSNTASAGPAASAPAPASRSARPCAYGPRGADGYCPKRPANSTSTRTPRAPAAPRPKPPCRYGPRGEDGYCPKKPPTNRTATRARRQAEQLVERTVVTATKKAVPVVAQYGPQVASFIAKTGLVLAAGYAAYWITTQLQRFRNATVADLRYELANQYRTARRAFAAHYGRNLTPAEQADLATWYKRKDAELRAYGPDTKKVPLSFRWE